MKKCTVCKVEKEFTSFYKDKRAKDGCYSCCKTCMDFKNSEWRSKNPERMKILKDASHKRHQEKERLSAREYAKKLREENYKKYKENKDKWDRENPERAKEISKKAIKKYYIKNYKQLYEKSRKWALENPHKIKEYRKKASKISRERYPEKDKARKLVAYAIEIEALIRPNECSRCLKGCKPEGHHQDYTKPLEVIWLCRECHNKEHGKSKTITNLVFIGR